jgi:signal peptidase II
MNFKNRALIVCVILFASVGFDRVTKIVAEQKLDPYEAIHLLHDTIRLQPTENKGAFLSLGSNVPEPMRYYIFTVAVGLFLSGLLVYLLLSKQWTRRQLVAMSLVLGGGYGNLIDRVFREGRVFDFMNVGIGRLRTGVFNVADLCITFGVLWFLYLSIKKKIPTEDAESSV